MTLDLPDYQKGVVLYALYGGELIPITVDANGNLVALMKGTDGTNLVTLKTDADGNIIAVIKGQYGSVLKTVATNEEGFILIKELPLLTYDRKGDVIWWDDFEDGINKWGYAPPNYPYIPPLSLHTAREGGQSLMLRADPDTGVYNMIWKYIPTLQPAPYGFEFSYAVSSYAHQVKQELFYFDGTTLWLAKIYYDQPTNTFYYLNSSNEYVALTPSLELYADWRAFHTQKLVINPGSGKYVKLIVNGYTFDMSTISLYNYASSEAAHLYISIWNTATGAAKADIYIDHVVVTSSEPLT